MKFADADLVGVPVQLVVGAKGVGRGVVERKVRATGERDELPLADLGDPRVAVDAAPITIVRASFASPRSPLGSVGPASELGRGGPAQHASPRGTRTRP